MKQKIGFVLVLMVLALLFTACGDEFTATPASVATTAATPKKAALGDDSVSEIKNVTLSGNYANPLDSTPDLTGTNTYFTATGSKGTGVFKVPSTGGAATEVFTGAPFVKARGLAFSPDGQQLFVTDPAAMGEGGKTGQIFVLPLNGGAPVALAGSAGTTPQNLDVVSQEGQTILYFTGKAEGQPALFKLPAKGADAPTIVLKGAPLVDPDGVAVTRSGLIYVSDRAGGTGNTGRVFKVSGNSATPIVDKVQTGNPAGIALSADDSLLLVSAHQADKPNDQVLLVDLKTLQTGSVTKVVGENVAAGGVHLIPSRDKNLWTWADSTAGPQGPSAPGGRVFVVK